MRNARHVCAMEATVRGEQEDIKMASISSEGSASNAEDAFLSIVLVEVEVGGDRCGKLFIIALLTLTQRIAHR